MIFTSTTGCRVPVGIVGPRGSPPLFWCFFIRAPRALWRNSKSAAPYIWSSYHCAFFWGMVALRAWHYDENHYSGAIWPFLCDVSGLGLTLGPICLVNCSANINWLKVSPGKTRVRIHRRPVYGSDYPLGYGVWANLDIAPSYCWCVRFLPRWPRYSVI